MTLCRMQHKFDFHRIIGENDKAFVRVGEYAGLKLRLFAPVPFGTNGFKILKNDPKKSGLLGRRQLRSFGYRE